MHHRCNINTVAITHGRNDSTLRDHPAFSRNITQVHKKSETVRQARRSKTVRLLRYANAKPPDLILESHSIAFSSYLISALEAPDEGRNPACDEAAAVCLPTTHHNTSPVPPANTTKTQLSFLVQRLRANAGFSWRRVFADSVEPPLADDMDVQALT